MVRYPVGASYGVSQMLSVANVTTTAKVAPSDPANNQQTSNPGGHARGEIAAEAKAAATRAAAIDPAKQSTTPQRLRDGENHETRPERDLPAGPPPAFVESILQRRAREALDPQQQRRAFEEARLAEANSPEVDFKG